MSKKEISILVVLILLGIIVSIIFCLSKDFGIENLGRSLMALYKIKTDKNVDYVEINENEYIVKNRKIRMSYTFQNKENSEKPIEPATFELYKDRIYYSVAKVATAK